MPTIIIDINLYFTMRKGCKLMASMLLSNCMWSMIIYGYAYTIWNKYVVLWLSTINENIFYLIF